MYLEQEVVNILEAVCYAGEQFDFVVYTFENSHCNIVDEVVEEAMAFMEELNCQFYKRSNFRFHGGNNPFFKIGSGCFLILGLIYVQILHRNCSL